MISYVSTECIWPNEESSQLGDLIKAPENASGTSRVINSKWTRQKYTKDRKSSKPSGHRHGTVCDKELLSCKTYFFNADNAHIVEPSLEIDPARSNLKCCNFVSLHNFSQDGKNH